MEYAIKVCTAMMGDVIPLYEVAETMARHAASGYGQSPLHGPTLQDRRPICIAILVDAARDGRLTVCGINGQVASVQKLCESTELPPEWKFDDPKARDIMALHAKASHLVDWGRSNDDVFHIVDTSDEVVVTDLKNHDGEVIEAGYYRSYVRGLDYSSPAYKPPTAPLVAGASAGVEPARTRRDSVTPAIEVAQSKCRNPTDTAQVWPELQAMAAKNVAPFIGETEEGLQYRVKGDIRYFTRDALDKRLHPEKRTSPAKRR